MTASPAAQSYQCRMVVYYSRPAPDLVREDVERLVFEARAYNAMNGIYGLLTFDARGYLQVLEGSDEAVEEMLVKIRRDPRHRDMVTLLDRVDEQRQFMTFYDFICAPSQSASLALLPDSSRTRLSNEVVAAIEAGYAAL